MASECEDESVVIEETLRESFFDYLDQVVNDIFSRVLNDWSFKLQTTPHNLEEEKLQKLKNAIVSAFFQWMKLRLPTSIIKALPM